MWVYLVTNTRNGKRYVGITDCTLEERWKQHVQASRGKTTRPLMRAIAKHGPESFTIEQLEECSDRTTLLQRERQLIVELDTFKPKGYNATMGGEGIAGHRHSEETRRKMSEARRGKPIGAFSEEHRRNISLALTGKKRGPSRLRGSKRSQQAVENTAKALWVPIVQCDMDWNMVRIYESMKAAAEALGCKPQGISRACRFPRRSANGFKWCYLLQDGTEQVQ